jgi:hypothetical protein
MVKPIIGIALGLVIGIGCRSFGIPLPSPRRSARATRADGRRARRGRDTTVAERISHPSHSLPRAARLARRRCELVAASSSQLRAQAGSGRQRTIGALCHASPERMPSTPDLRSKAL